MRSRGPLAFLFVLPPPFTASEHEPVRTGIAKVQERAIHWGAQQERSRCLIQRCQPSLQLVDRRAAQLSEVFLLQPTIQLCAAQEGVSVAVLDNHSPNAADARIILVQRGDSTRHCADQPPGSGRSPSPTVAGIPMTTGPPGPLRTPGSPPESVSNAFQVHARIRYPHCYRRRHLLLSCGMPLLATARSTVAFWTVAATSSSHAFFSAQNAAALSSTLSSASAPFSSRTPSHPLLPTCPRTRPRSTRGPTAGG